MTIRQASNSEVQAGCAAGGGLSGLDDSGNAPADAKPKIGKRPHGTGASPPGSQGMQSSGAALAGTTLRKPRRSVRPGMPATPEVHIGSRAIRLADRSQAGNRNRQSQPFHAASGKFAAECREDPPRSSVVKSDTLKPGLSRRSERVVSGDLRSLASPVS